MDQLNRLQAKIEDRSALLGVIGLGYVGLPMACLFADAGFRVHGIEVRSERVALINQGHNPIVGDEPGLSELLAGVVGQGRLSATTEYAPLAAADIVLINVETPVDRDHQPRYAALQAACRDLGPRLKPGALVIVESTVAPGTLAGVVRPLIEASSGGRVNADFYLGHCPERVMPGKLLANLRGVSRVCGASAPAVAQVMVNLYRWIVQADLDVSDLVTAELVKTAENAYRDVNIAFANELALICEAVGGDVWQVRELVNKSPGRHVLLPGAGVGGHCIPKDPWLLAHGAGGQVPVRLIPAARSINDDMPRHIARLVEAGLAGQGRGLAAARVAVLGYAYLENSDDTRDSPSAALVAQLRAAGAEIAVHDPFVPEYQGPVPGTIRGADALVLMVAHDAYRELPLVELRPLMRTPVLVDGRHLFDAGIARAAGFRYLGVGKGRRDDGLNG